MPWRSGRKVLNHFVFGLAEVFHVVEAFATAEQAAQGDHEHVDQLVFAAASHARIGQLSQMGDETEFWMHLHPHSSKHTVQKYKVKMSHPSKNFDASALHQYPVVRTNVGSILC